MVKKVSGSKTGKTSGATPVQPTKTVESSKVGSVEQVKNAEKQAPAGGVSGLGPKITPEMQEQILQMIDEEAEKMFGDASGLPESKKETVKGAVKMAIQAGLIDDEDEKGK